MTPFEVIVVVSVIAIGTSFTNVLVTHIVGLVTDLNCRLLCSEPSTKPEAPTAFLHIYKVLSQVMNHYARNATETEISRGYLASLPQRHQPINSLNKTSAVFSSTGKELPSSPMASSKLRTLFLSLAETYPDHVYLGHSTFSPEGNISLLSRSRSNSTKKSQTQYHGEIAHVHAATASASDSCTIHIILHPSDVALAVATGWTQTRPPSSTHRRGVYSTIVVSPRDEADLEVVKEITKAAIWYARGKGDGTLREEEGVMYLDAWH